MLPRMYVIGWRLLISLCFDGAGSEDATDERSSLRFARWRNRFRMRSGMPFLRSGLLRAGAFCRPLKKGADRGLTE